jgi:N6-adenosine-specific RNA methylase IME4
MLPEALNLLPAWGFQYKSSMFWIKPTVGTGYWLRNQAEILLIGTKGNVPAPAPGEQPPQVVTASRGKHSEKPAAFVENIERLFPSVPKLELFARRARPGWDGWGNEVDAPAIMKSLVPPPRGDGLRPTGGLDRGI